MALTEETKIDKIEILEDGQIQVRRATIIYRDGVEVSRTNHRHVLDPGVDVANLPDQDERVQAVARALWTPEVKAARSAFLAKQKR